jgi:hypothetical protein
MAILWLYDDLFKKCDGKYQEREILRTLKNMKDNWAAHILCRNCLLTHVVERRLERKIEGKRGWGRRCKQLLDDSKETILKH